VFEEAGGAAVDGLGSARWVLVNVIFIDRYYRYPSLKLLVAVVRVAKKPRGYLLLHARRALWRKKFLEYF